jgi:hypothetical protein
MKKDISLDLTAVKKLFEDKRYFNHHWNEQGLERDKT